MATKISLPIANPDFEDGAPQPDATGSTERPRTRAEGGDVMSEIEREIKDHRVFLYMKGTPSAPMCGFSARVTQILNHVGAEYATCNILDDQEKRAAIKVYADWPTIPQLYVDGEFVGGCDIVTEMFQDGELEALIKGA